MTRKAFVPVRVPSEADTGAWERRRDAVSAETRRPEFVQRSLEE